MRVLTSHGIAGLGHTAALAVFTHIGNVNLVLLGFLEHLQHGTHVLLRVEIEGERWAHLSFSGVPVTSIRGTNSKLSLHPTCIESKLEIGVR